MKLSPPASSSDIEVARQIARRLHQRRRRDDRPPLDPGPAERSPQTAAAHAVAPPPWNPPASFAEPAPTPDESAPLPAPPDFGPAVEEPAPPSWDAAPADGEVQEPEDALDALTSEPDSQPEPAAGLEDAPPDSADLDVGALDPGGDTPPTEGFEEADAYGGSPQVSPFGETDTLEPPDIEPADLPPPDEEEELFDSPAGPSWGDVAESCMDIAHARGALLADGTGGLIAARGEWPEPGPEAIASRLVAMMDRTLKDAPNRSVSAPVGGMHLTAWRAPAGERVLTVAFIADSPVPATLRPEIDAEIGQGAGP
jgi:hypothetical protein